MKQTEYEKRIEELSKLIAPKNFKYFEQGYDFALKEVREWINKNYIKIDIEGTIRFMVDLKELEKKMGE